MSNEEQLSGTQDETSQKDETETVPFKSDPSTSAKTSSIHNLTKEADKVYEELFITTSEVKEAKSNTTKIFEQYKEYIEDNPEAETAPVHSALYNKFRELLEEFEVAEKLENTLKEQESRLKSHLRALNVLQEHKTSNDLDAGSQASSNRI